MVLLYEDSTDLDAFKLLLADLDWNYAGRVHDQEGKLHHHIVILFKDGRKAADIADDLCIETRWLRAWDRKKKALRYLCHKDNPDKYQYSTDGIYGTIAEQAVSACSKGDQQSEQQSLQEVLDLLNATETALSYSLFLQMLNEKGLFSVFRRMGVLGVRLLDEHNAKYAASDNFRDDMRRDREAFALRLTEIEKDFAERCERLEKLGFPAQELK